MKTRIEVLICDICPFERRVPAYKTVRISGIHGGNPIIRDLCRKHVDMLAADPHIRDAEPPVTMAEKEMVEAAQDLAPSKACVDCGRRFVDNRALGAHRWRSHGVKGEHRKEKAA